jgi:hypothetical protein
MKKYVPMARDPLLEVRPWMLTGRMADKGVAGRPKTHVFPEFSPPMAPLDFINTANGMPNGLRACRSGCQFCYDRARAGFGGVLS